MTHDAYSTKRVTVWDQEKDGVAGKAIKYQDGYISWCPNAVYERDYQPTDAMSFGHALHALERGERVARVGWNGKGMFIFRVNGSTFAVNREPLRSILGPGTIVDYHAHIDMKAADDSIFVWTPNQLDMLAKDWMIVAPQFA